MLLGKCVNCTWIYYHIYLYFYNKSFKYNHMECFIITCDLYIDYFWIIKGNAIKARLRSSLALKMRSNGNGHRQSLL